MTRTSTATVIRVLGERPGAVELAVEVGGEGAQAIAYPDLTGPVAPGDTVLVNTSAVDLGLGTGGWHFVVAVVRQGDGVGAAGAPPDAGGGHVMKVRYTPVQIPVLGVEEAAGPHHDVMARADSLDGAPVVWMPLHSMLAPVAAGAMAAGARRIVYVMTDGAALPAAFSRLTSRLRAEGLLHGTVTAGQAFGGDLEAVTVFSALLAARHVMEAEVIAVADGPGNTGTRTRWGASNVGSSMSLNASAILHGRPVAALRVSFADPRPEHRGVSHHSITALSRVAMAGVHVAVPALEDATQREAVWTALRGAGLEDRHQLVEANGTPALEVLEGRGIRAESMGRTPADDPAFFLAAGAAGVLAARMSAGDRLWREAGIGD